MRRLRALMPLRHRSSSRVVALLVACVVCLLARSGAAQVTPHFKQLQPFNLSVAADPTMLGVQVFTLADVNKDSKLDLIAIDQTNVKVNVCLGNGDGTFKACQAYEAPGDNDMPTAVAVADVSSPSFGAPDHNPDIIVGSDQGSVWILLGDGTGNFTAHEQDLADLDNFNPTSVVGFALGDFDGNGTIDIAAGDDSGCVYFACNNNGVFASCATDMVDTTGNSVVDIVAGDFDGNGKLDVATLNDEGTNSDGTHPPDVSVIYGNGDGSFNDVSSTTKVGGELDSMAKDLAVGLIDGNTTSDLVAQSSGAIGEFYLVELLGRSNVQQFISSNVVINADSSAVALADFNGDGFLDALETNQAAGSNASIQLGVGDGRGTFGDSNGLEGVGLPAAIGIAAGDIGGDTLPDFVVLLADGQRMLAVINDTNDKTRPTDTPGGGHSPTPGTPGTTGPAGTPTPTPPPPTATATSTPTAIPTANYGRCDLQASQGQLAGIATGDFNGDGTQDIAVTDSTNNAVYVILNTAEQEKALTGCAMSMSTMPISPKSLTTIPVTGVPGAIIASDIDRDGDLDLVVAESDGIVVLRNQGGGQFMREAPIAVDGVPVAIVADYPTNPQDPTVRQWLDLNNDTYPDLVVANQGTPNLTVIYGCAGGQAACLSKSSVKIFASANTIAAADFDRDDKVDLVVGEGTDAVFLKQTGLDASGHSQFSPNSFGPGNSIVNVASGYFNGDLLPDLLITRTNEADVYLFQNGGFSKNGSLAIGSAPSIPNPPGTVTPGPVAAGIGLFNAIDMSSDAVVANFHDSALYFGMGDGTGVFRSPAILSFALGGAPVALAVAKIDGDGMVDVVTANQNGTISVLLSSVPPPTPIPPPTGTPTDTGTPTISGTPTPTPSPTPNGSATITPTPVATATLKLGAFSVSGCSIDDTPGHPSLGAVAILALLLLARRLRPRRARSVLGLLCAATLGWFGSASAQTLPAAYLTCTVPSGSLGGTSSITAGAVGRFDDNLSPDLVLLDPMHNQFAVELTDTDLFKIGSCAQAITAVTTAVQSPKAVASDLINGDNLSDLVIAQQLSGQVHVFTNGGSGTFASGATASGLTNIPTTVAVGDLDGDHNTDLVVGDQRGVISVLFGATNSSNVYALLPPVVVGTFADEDEVVAVRIANFDGNQFPDIAAVDRFGTANVFLQTAARTFATTPSATVIVAGVPNDMQIADPAVFHTTGGFDDFPVPDLAFISKDGKLRVFLGQCNGGTTMFPCTGAGATVSFSAQTPVATGSNPSALGLSDLDRDGKLDAVVSDLSASQVSFFRGDGTGTLVQSGDPQSTVQGQGSTTIGENPNAILLADLDGDGKDDVITANSDGSLTIFLSSDPPATVTPTETPTGTPTLVPTITPTPTLTVPQTPTVTPTPSQTFTVTGTTTPNGQFQVMGTGCADVGGGSGLADAMPLLVLAALFVLRRRAQA